jgi:hypothetical protein
MACLRARGQVLSVFAWFLADSGYCKFFAPDDLRPRFGRRAGGKVGLATAGVRIGFSCLPLSTSFSYRFRRHGSASTGAVRRNALIADAAARLEKRTNEPNAHAGTTEHPRFLDTADARTGEGMPLWKGRRVLGPSAVRTRKSVYGVPPLPNGENSAQCRVALSGPDRPGSAGQASQNPCITSLTVPTSTSAP